MGRVQLYANTGKLVYDSEGDPSENRIVERIKNEYERGVAFYIDPAEGIVRGQVKVHRHGPEQFVAAYMAESADSLIEDFVDAVTRAVEEAGWSIYRSAGGNQAVFNSFESGVAFSSESHERIRRQFGQGVMSVERLRQEVKTNRPVTLLVPDYETAASAFAYISSQIGEDYSFAITESTEVSTIQTSHVFLRPTGRVDVIAPGEEFSQRLQQERAKATKDRVNADVHDLVEAIEARGKRPANVLPPLINAQDIGGELGFVLGNANKQAGRRYSSIWWVVITAPISFGAAYGLSFSSIAMTEELIAAIAGAVVFVSGLLVWIGLLWITRSKPFPRRSRGIRRSALDEDLINRSENLVNALGQLKENISGKAVRNFLSSLLEPHGIVLRDSTRSHRRRKFYPLVGLVLGIVIGLLIFIIIISSIVQL